MKKLTKEEFINKAILKHGDIFDYDKVDYISHKKEVEIFCKKHGYFKIIANNLLNGRGCQKCGKIKNHINLKTNNEEYIERCNKIHDYKYDYSLTKYINQKIKIKIICPIHGLFEQYPNNHVRGNGCRKCYKTISKGEIEVSNFIKEIGYNTQTGNRKLISPFEIDIYIPLLKKGIEFNGEYWHYDNRNKNKKKSGYHAMKSNLCRKKGIKLLHIREDLWIKDKEKMKKVIEKFLYYEN